MRRLILRNGILGIMMMAQGNKCWNNEGDQKMR
jgi:hypothetical protein